MANQQHPGQRMTAMFFCRSPIWRSP